MDLNTAKSLLKETFDSAFNKKTGTKKQRVSMALVCVRKVPCSDGIALHLWAVDYCESWKK